MMNEESVYHLIHRYWVSFARHFKLFLWIFAGTLLISLYVAFHAPKVYEAETTFYFPLQSPGGAAGAISQSVLGKGGGAEGIFASLLPNSQAGLQDYTKGVLGSRRIADMLIDRFHLMDYYHTRFESAAVNNLLRSTTITLTPEGIMQIKVGAGSPQMAADLANGYVDAYREYSSTSTVSIAKKHREDVEEQLAELRGKLADAETDMANFQGRYKSADFSREAQAMVQSLLQLRMQKLASQVEQKAAGAKVRQAETLMVRNLQSASRNPLISSSSLDDPILSNLRNELADVYTHYSQAKATETPANPELQSYRQQVHDLEASLRTQLKRQIQAHNQGISGDLLNLEIAAQSAGDQTAAYQTAISALEKTMKPYPNIGLDYERKSRKLKVLESLYLYLSTERERAILQEAKESPDFEVLDKAIPPDFKSSPALRTYLMVGFMLGLILGFLGTLAADYFLSPSSPILLWKLNGRRRLDPDVADEIMN